MTAPLDFEFKPFDRMTPEDYALLGFRSGLEIHQQLKTRRKLFCRCPAGKYSERVDAEILRHMRPTLSELGEYDGTALMEFKTKKEIIYLLNRDTVCTYEMDDAPPFEIDPEAVEIAVELALLLKLNMVSELHIARKQYLDGSIPTGFQRTTILGVDGSIQACGRSIGIIQLGLEEDSCREVSDVGHRITFRTDRLGMPLCETVTEPAMRTPREVAEAAEAIRRLSRSTGRVRTGAGAARQDVNVSIDGGTRIEIKGVSSIGRIPRLVYNEAMRQHNLLKIREKLRSRGLSAETFESSTADVTHMVRPSRYLPLSQALDQGHRAGAVRLGGFKGILAHPTQEHTFFAQEFSDRVKVVACLMGRPNILHSDSTEPGLTRGLWNRIRKRLRASWDDTLVVVWGPQEDVRTAEQEIIDRAVEALEGVPSETRQAYADGTNGFERILPGPDRMYPDTDEPPQAIPDETVERIRARLPELPWERKERLAVLGVPESTAERLIRSHWMELFDHVRAECEMPAAELAKLFDRDLPYWRRRGYPVERLADDEAFAIFRAVRENRLETDALPYVLGLCLDDNCSPDESALSRFCKRGTEDEDLDRAVSDAAELQFLLKSRKKTGRIRYLMGNIMSRLRGRVAARDVKARLLEVIEGDDD